MVVTEQITFNSPGDNYIALLTDRINELIERSGVQSGMALVHCLHTTGAVLVVEYEYGMLKDLKNSLEQLFPQGGEYEHHARAVDTNGHAHVRSAFLQASLALPVDDGRLTLGSCQDLICIDMNDFPREFALAVKIIGE
jgi:secondary thiamine-phosphate synthase enzyme